MTKLCKRCGESKSRDCFVRDKRMADRLKSWCKDCCRRQREENADSYRETNRRYRERNAKKIRERIKRWNSDNAERVRQRSAAWVAQNKDRIKAYKAKHRRTELGRDTARKYRKSYDAQESVRKRERELRKRPEFRLKNRIKSIRRRATERGAEGVFDWAIALASHGGACAFCKSTDRLTVDHIVPLSRGGSNSQENVRPLCLSCNSAKGGRLDSELPDSLLQRIKEIA